MEILPIVIIGVGLAGGFALSGLVAWKIWKAKHDKLTAIGAINN